MQSSTHEIMGACNPFHHKNTEKDGLTVELQLDASHLLYLPTYLLEFFGFRKRKNRIVEATLPVGLEMGIPWESRTPRVQLSDGDRCHEGMREIGEVGW